LDGSLLKICPAEPDTIWKGTTQGSFQQSLVETGSVVSEEKIFFNFIPLFSIFSLATILVGSRDHRTQQTTDDRRKVMAIAHMAQRPGELKKKEKLCPAFQTSDQDGHHSRT
jgi:hypothetical protein